MAYGELKVDSITFTNGGSDTTVSVSGLVQNPTFSGDITVTGTISGDVVQGGTLVSGATVSGTAGEFGTITGNTAGFTTVTGTTVTGTTSNFVSGVFTTQISGATITGNAGQFSTITGNTVGFTTVTGTTVTGTTANFVTVSGATVTGNAAQFTTLTGGTAGFTTVTGTTVTGTTANFATLSGTTVTGGAGQFTSLTSTTATITSGVFASGTAAAPSVSVGTTDNGLYSPGADQVAISTNGAERLRIQSNGNVNIRRNGSHTDSSARLSVFNSGASESWNVRPGTNVANEIQFLSYNYGTGSYLPLKNLASEWIWFSGAYGEVARIDSLGRLLVGTSSELSGGAIDSGSGSQTSLPRLQIAGTDWAQSSAIFASYQNAAPVFPQISLNKSKSGTVGTIGTALASGDALGGITFSGSDGTKFVAGASITAYTDAACGTNDLPGRLVFSTTADGASSPTEQMRIDKSGNIFGGNGFPGTASSTDTGFGLTQAGFFRIFRSAGQVVEIGRQTNDGELVAFYQAGTKEGTISVSGTTVSYNGAHLSRWSQLPSIDPQDKTNRPVILRGTVMSNLDDMCDWIDPESGEAQENEQLNRTKISDVEGDKNVAGVFQSWDDDDTWVNDFYLAMTGDFVIRVAQGVTVERGDLLMSAGDGTAKPQDDDIIRSKTIAKVTSTTVSCTHPDGSYCVPCVLMAC